MDTNESGRQYIGLYFDVVTSKLYRDLPGDALKLYFLLRRYICRSRSDHSLSLFYVQGYLAVSGYLGTYAQIFNKSRSTISRWLQALEDARVIWTYQSSTREDLPNIWILGQVLHIEGSKYGEEILFLDHLAEAQEHDGETHIAFDKTRMEQANYPKIKEGDFTVSLLQRRVQRRVQRSNIEDTIDKTNIPPSETAEPVNVSKILRGTLTKGEDDQEVSALAAYIGQQMHSPVPSGKLNSLALGYTEQLPGGKQRQHPSPDELWVTHPLYAQYVRERIDYYKGQSGSAAVKRNKLVNALCSYKGNPWSWLEWLARHGEPEPEPTEVGNFIVPEQMPDLTEEQAAELAAWAEERGRNIDLPM